MIKQRLNIGPLWEDVVKWVHHTLVCSEYPWHFRRNVSSPLAKRVRKYDQAVVSNREATTRLSALATPGEKIIDSAFVSTSGTGE